MNYKMHLIIHNPRTPEGMNSDIGMCLDARFARSENTYGNKYYVCISDHHGFENLYDIRYDASFDPNNKATWLERWAHNYWNGKDGAYAIKTLEIEHSKE